MSPTMLYYPTMLDMTLGRHYKYNPMLPGGEKRKSLVSPLLNGWKANWTNHCGCFYLCSANSVPRLRKTPSSRHVVGRRWSPGARLVHNLTAETPPSSWIAVRECLLRMTANAPHQCECVVFNWSHRPPPALSAVVLSMDWLWQLSIAHLRQAVTHWRVSQHPCLLFYNRNIFCVWLRGPTARIIQDAVSSARFRSCCCSRCLMSRSPRSSWENAEDVCGRKTILTCSCCCRWHDPAVCLSSLWASGSGSSLPPDQRPTGLHNLNIHASGVGRDSMSI